MICRSRDCYEELDLKFILNVEKGVSRIFTMQ
jgi:hypothetical protein